MVHSINYIMKKTVFTLILLSTLGIFSLVAQNNNPNNYVAQVFLDYVDRHGSDNLDYLEDEYKGTPYNNPIFLLGNIYKLDKIVVENYALRYNAMTDEIEVKETLYVEDDEIQALVRDPEFYVKIMGDMFVFVQGNEIIDQAGYFQVMHAGDNYHLYKKIVKKYYPPKKAQNSFEKDVLASFVDRSEYYLVSQDGKFQEFGSSKKKRLKLFNDRQAEIKKYVSNGRLDLTEEEDLMKVVKYYDTISVM